MRCVGLCRTASANVALPRLRSAEADRICLVALMPRPTARNSSKVPHKGMGTYREHDVNDGWALEPPFIDVSEQRDCHGVRLIARTGLAGAPSVRSSAYRVTLPLSIP